MYVRDLTWTGHAVVLAGLLLGGGLHLVDDGLRVDAAAVKMALVRQQVLGVVLAKRVGRTRRRTDTQQPRYVFPRLVLRHLRMRTPNLINVFAKKREGDFAYVCLSTAQYEMI